MLSRLIFTLVLLPGITCLYAQEKKEYLELPNDAVINIKRPQHSVTQGSVTIEGKIINYHAIAGTLVLRNNLDTPTIAMSYVAYFKDDESKFQRPITFVYNGGPGSATFWLHMGAWGPQRVDLNDTARTKPPYRTVNNNNSLLDVSDLVFIDAPGTGFGEIITKERGGAGDPKDFYGIDGDAQAFANFITQFLSDFNRWNSPKYLFGESYGTMRSAVLANILQSDRNVGLNGVILLSQILSYNNSSDRAALDPGDDQPYFLILPSMAATAWYHHKIPNQPQNLEPFLREVEQFSLNDFALALHKGSLLDDATFNAIAEKLHNYTGLPVDYIRKANLRVTGPQFEHELLRDENEITGRLDSRFSSYTYNPLGETAEFDPMSTFTGPGFTAAFNSYVRNQLNFGKGMTYKTSGQNINGQWDFRHLVPGGNNPRPFFANVSPDLARAMIYNPQLKVMLNMGYFDLGTAYFQGLYEMHHLPMPASLQKNIEYDFYHSGHMVYLNPESFKKLHDNVARFINSTH